MNEAKNIWEAIPDFSQMWKSNNNYGYTLAIEGIVASVSPYTRYVRKRVTDTSFVATITGFGLPHQLRNDSITSIDAGKMWCEPWVCHFYKLVQLQKQVECYRGWLDHYEQDNDALRTKLHEYELREIRERFQDSLEQGGQA